MHTLKKLINELGELEKVIGYTFKNRENIILALTHSSYSNENKSKKMQNNERLEFLGDAVLNISISEKIYKNLKGLAEGEMTKLRATIVCESSLVKSAYKINLGKYILLGKGEELTGGRTRSSILSDAYEALIGAIYLDGGLEDAKLFIYGGMQNVIDDCIKGSIFLDYKTLLQETAQKNNDCRIIYEVVEEKGPDHNKAFVTRVIINDTVMGIGEGKSKKESEQNSAKVALEKCTNKT